MKLLPLALLMVAAAPSAELRYFQYQREVRLPPGASGQTCVLVDPGVFTHGSPELADVRLYRDGVEAPYVLQQALPEQGQQQSLALLNRGTRAGKTVFDAAMPGGVYSDLKLEVSAKDFLATVTVSGSLDQGVAATRIGSYTIFDLTGQKLGRSTVLHLPDSTFRFLRFEVDGRLAPEDFTGISVVRLPESQPRYVTVAESSQISIKDHASVVEITIPAHVPVDRVVFDPPADPINFSRDVTVSAVAQHSATASETGRPAQPVTSFGNLLRIRRVEDGHRIDEERLAIDAPQPFGEDPTRWTITVANGDDAPLRIRSVRLQMVERDLCFEAVASSRYTLAYGDPALAAPRYDYGAWFTPHSGPALVALGPEAPNPAYRARPDSRPFSERHPALLWVALILVVIVLGTVALRTARRERPSAQA